MFDANKNEKIGRKAHIEAESKAGPRYNDKQTPKQRNSFENLMLMCPTHHTIIDNDPKTYTVEALKEMKRKHEEKYHKKIRNLARMRDAFLLDTIIPNAFRGEKTIFIGRENEIKDIVRHLSELHTPLSIVGIGGMGKTATTFKALHQLENKDLVDIVIDIYFEPQITYETFLSNLATKLSLPIKGFHKLRLEDRKNFLLNEIASFRRPLVLLDNYEYISEGLVNRSPEADGKKINSFLEEVPTQTLIVLTSTNRNNMTGEYLYQIAGLNQKDCIDLFVRTANKYFGKSISEKMLSLIGGLSERLGGHPLAIKLLAGSYQGGGITEMEDVLNRIDIDLSNVMEQDSRFRSIRACLNYSFNKLSRESQLALLKIVFFRSPFPSKTFEDVLGSPVSILHELFVRCFLERNELNEYDEVPQKFWLYDLHPIIREYLQNMASQQTISVEFKENYVKFYEEMIKTADFGIGKQEYNLLEKIVAIISERKDNDFKNAINLIPNLEHRSLVSNHLGIVTLKLHLYNDGLYYHNLCLGIDRDMNRHDRVAIDYAHIGNSFSGLGEIDKAEENYEKALEVSKNLDEKAISGAYANLASAMLSEENVDKALEYCKKALELSNKLDDKKGLSQNYTTLANIHHKKGNDLVALGCHQKALSIDEQLNDQLGMSADDNNIGIMIKRLGDVDKSIEYYTKALDIDGRLDNKRGLLRTYKNIVIALSLKGDNINAQKYFDEFLAVWAQMNKRPPTEDDVRNAWNSPHYTHLITD
jgi:tetratricopeptide (TPR) repeat protein